MTTIGAITQISLHIINLLWFIYVVFISFLFPLKKTDEEIEWSCCVDHYPKHMQGFVNVDNLSMLPGFSYHFDLTVKGDILLIIAPMPPKSLAFQLHLITGE